MAAIATFIRRGPLPSYFFLTFAIPWGVFFLLSRGQPLSGDDAMSDPRFLATVLLAPLAPATASILITAILSGKQGLMELRERLGRWRVTAHWYAVALLSAPLVAIATGAGLSLASGSSDYLPALFSTGSPLGLLLPGLMTGALVGLGEELGWTGFAVPRLRAHHGAVATGLLVGFVWGLWHFPLFWESDSFSDLLPAALLLVALFSWLPPYRVLMVWVHDGTQSLFVAVLMHASLSATQVVLLPSDLSDSQSLVSMLARSGAWWLIVAVVALSRRSQPARQVLRPTPA